MGAGSGPAVHELLVPRIHHLHWPARFLRQQHGIGVHDTTKLSAEPTTNRHPVDVDLVGGDAERVGEVTADAERPLRARPHGHFPAHVYVGHRYLRLDVGLVSAGDIEGVRIDAVGLREPGFHVAFDAMVLAGDVIELRHAPRVIGRRVEQLGALVNHRHGFLDRVEHVPRSLQRLVLHFDQVCRLFRQLLGHRGDGSHLLTLVMHLVLSKERLHPAGGVHLLLDNERLVSGERLLCNHGQDSREPLGLARINLLDERMRVWAAEEDTPQHPRRRHVGSVQGTAGHFLQRIYPRGALANDLEPVGLPVRRDALSVSYLNHALCSFRSMPVNGALRMSPSVTFRELPSRSLPSPALRQPSTPL